MLLETKPPLALEAKTAPLDSKEDPLENKEEHNERIQVPVEAVGEYMRSTPTLNCDEIETAKHFFHVFSVFDDAIDITELVSLVCPPWDSGVRGNAMDDVEANTRRATSAKEQYDKTKRHAILYSSDELQKKAAVRARGEPLDKDGRDRVYAAVLDALDPNNTGKIDLAEVEDRSLIFKIGDETRLASSRFWKERIMQAHNYVEKTRTGLQNAIAFPDPEAAAKKLQQVIPGMHNCCF